jgi:hypothetical protein
MKGLSKYKLNKAFTEGVDIRLDDAPDVVFRVKLPSQYNRAYTQAMYSSMEFDVSDDGTVKPGGDLVDMRYAAEDAFMNHCLISVDGEPIPSDFAEVYAPAIPELMDKAQELANAIDSKVDDAVGKSSTSSTGSTSGEEKSPSTLDLKNVAS